ncbi:F-BOX DOMAIN CONTAINING PROTEIN EXPRESSED [Salix koriyanagi]|uniref:F-BOX DOMAIN CONTAINING PROTEIN EXPRESSED n=1 Tax=Salix koriyanagi TaxID=2511006 RepID=A0A9Q0X2H3_9ROSI|nr:F-BOX DOMAIN CONTAINING PROTEIN EXPRESSED [Salix koriyanagi]
MKIETHCCRSHEHARLCPDKGLHLHIISQVANCCNISELGFHGNITEKEVLAIVEGLPELRILDFSDSTLSSKALLMVLDGKLKCLYELNVLHCLIKDVDGKDIGAHMHDLLFI